MENKPSGIDKRQVALKQVQALHECPLRFPNEFDLHCEGKKVVPNKHRHRRDCGENKKFLNGFPIAELTLEALAVGPHRQL